MARHNSGIIYEVLEGIHAGKRVWALHRDQRQEIKKAGKVCATVDEPKPQASLFAECQQTQIKKVLISPAFLKIVGFFD